LNAHLFRNTSEDRYATLFYATYDCETHMLTYTNAGHLPPLFIVNGSPERLDQGGGTVVGLFEETPYTQVTRRVPPGSLLVAYSDGLTEAVNVYGEEFGMNRVKEEILRHQELPARQLMQALIDASEKWTGTSERADDVTVVVARMS
jgi:sigma-B regulation protein RsbU (phosphoserine phosphatase)